MDLGEAGGQAGLETQLGPAAPDTNPSCTLDFIPERVLVGLQLHRQQEFASQKSLGRER